MSISGGDQGRNNFNQHTNVLTLRDQKSVDTTIRNVYGSLREMPAQNEDLSKKLVTDPAQVSQSISQTAFSNQRLGGDYVHDAYLLKQQKWKNNQPQNNKPTLEYLDSLKKSNTTYHIK